MSKPAQVQAGLCQRDQISKRAAEASRVALAGAALRAVLPRYTELVALPVFAGDVLRS